MERQLVVLAQQGDRDAFDQLVLRVVDRLYAVAYRILRSGPNAEDATQQALVAIRRRLPALRDPDRFDAWAYRLLVHASYAEHRRRRWEAPPGSLTDGATHTDPYPLVHDRDQLESSSGTTIVKGPSWPDTPRRSAQPSTPGSLTSTAHSPGSTARPTRARVPRRPRRFSRSWTRSDSASPAARGNATRTSEPPGIVAC